MKAPLGRAARAKRPTEQLCTFCAGTLAVKLAREADRLDRQSIRSFGPRRPFADDFFIWSIVQKARINGVQLCTNPEGDDGSAEACTFCEYRHRHYGASADDVTARHALDPRRSARA